MRKMGRAYRFLKGKYDLLIKKRFTTIAGTLVFFLVMSLMPLSIWLALVFGRLHLPVERLIEMPVFSSVKSMITYVQREAETQTRGASLFLIVTALYSASSLFYHVRKSGEIVYGYTKKKSGWKIRVSAVLALFATLLLSALSAAVTLGGMVAFSRLFSSGVATGLCYLLMIAVSFVLVLLLNVYACPYRVKISSFIPGSLVTAFSWAVALVGFAVYLQFASTGRLYGALSAVIVFMLWLYVLTVCFVSGMIFNSEKIKTKKSKRL